MPVGALVLQLAAAERNLPGVHHDDEVAGVQVRREDRLVLAAQQRRYLAGQAAEHNVGGIDDVPLTLDVTGLGAESAHSRKPSQVDLIGGPRPGDPPGEGALAPAAA